MRGLGGNAMHLQSPQKSNPLGHASNDWVLPVPHATKDASLSENEDGDDVDDDDFPLDQVGAPPPDERQVSASETTSHIQDGEARLLPHVEGQFDLSLSSSLNQRNFLENTVATKSFVDDASASLFLQSADPQQKNPALTNPTQSTKSYTHPPGFERSSEKTSSEPVLIPPTLLQTAPVGLSEFSLRQTLKTDQPLANTGTVEQYTNMIGRVHASLSGSPSLWGKEDAVRSNQSNRSWLSTPLREDNSARIPLHVDGTSTLSVSSLGTASAPFRGEPWRAPNPVNPLDMATPVKQQHKDGAALPSSLSQVDPIPNAELHAYYGKPPRQRQIAGDSYVTWHDGGAAHAMRWTSVFVCPATGELFFSGRYAGAESLFVVPMRNSLRWFSRKVHAEHGAAARALDCLSFRNTTLGQSLKLELV